MKYEKINKNYTKIIISFIVIIIIGSVLVLNITKAKYKTTISVQIVNGTIKYYGGNADLNVMAVYQQKEDSDCTEDGCYNLVDDIPNAGYKIDIDKSYCTEPNNQKKQSNVISFKGDVLSVKMARKGTKCYLYFNKQKTSNNILTDLGLKSKGQATDLIKHRVTVDVIFKKMEYMKQKTTLEQVIILEVQ